MSARIECKTIYKTVLLMLVVMTFGSGLVLSSSYSYADDVVTDVSIDVPTACTLTGTLDAAHIAEIDSGTYRTDIGTTTFKVICNDNSGFAIYAAGYSNDTVGNNKLLATVGGALAPTYDIVTGTATSGSTSNWAMKLTSVAGTYAPTVLSDDDGAYSGYHIVPDGYTKVVTFPNGTDGVNGSSFTSTYAVLVSSAHPAGSYDGQVIYTLVHPASEVPAEPQATESGKICYYANTTTAVGTMGCQTIGTSDGTTSTSATLLASNFSRTGYGFAGWSDAYDYATSPSAHFYGPQETISFTEGQYSGDNTGLSLYAIWIPSVGALQDQAKVAQLCGTGAGSLTQAPTDGTANLASVSALTDQRDSQTYTIAKLADGNCWMIENLRLENTAAHNSDGTLAQGYNASFIGLADAEYANFTSSTVANSLYSVDGSTASTISGSDQEYRFPRYNNSNTQNRASGPTNANANTYSYGNYYTWHAVIADTTEYTSGNHNTTSICPKGWSVPIGNSVDAGYKKLDIDMGGTGLYQGSTEASNRWRKYPANFVFSGRFVSSSFSNRGSQGRYWSSTAYDTYGSNIVTLYNDGVSPSLDVFSKYYGFIVRCMVSL